MDTVEITGKTVDEAIAAASAKLGIPADRLDYTILTEGSKGILGIGAEDARIVVSMQPALAPGERPPAEGYAPAGSSLQPASVLAPSPQPEAPARATHVENAPDVAADLLEELLDKMGVDAEVEIRADEPITLNVIGQDLGILIGRRGETLSSLQFILNQMLNHQTGEWLSVVVDAEDYRLRREDQLRGLAKRMADRARYYRQSVTLEPMPPNERRIVHMALAEHPEVTTNSVGEGEDRRVVISPK